jgi:hypothetical protein
MICASDDKLERYNMPFLAAIPEAVALAVTATTTVVGAGVSIGTTVAQSNMNKQQQDFETKLAYMQNGNTVLVDMYKAIGAGMTDY